MACKIRIDDDRKEQLEFFHVRGPVEVGFLDVDSVGVLPARSRREFGVSVAVAPGKLFYEFGGLVDGSHGRRTLGFIQSGKSK